jgi:hypothetical protein
LNFGVIRSRAGFSPVCKNQSLSRADGSTAMARFWPINAKNDAKMNKKNAIFDSFGRFVTFGLSVAPACYCPFNADDEPTVKG